MRKLLGYICQDTSSRPVNHTSVRKQDGIIIDPGVRGWLLIFCLTLTVFYPIASILIFFTGIYRDLDYAFIPLMAILGIYTGIQLWKIRPYAVDKSKLFLIIYISISLFKILAPVYLMSVYRNKPDFSTYNGIRFIGDLLFFLAWYNYLEQSKRVKLTYLSKRKRIRNKKRGRRPRNRHRKFYNG